LLDGAEPTEAVLVSLINDLEVLAGPTVVALDDYHVVDAADVHEAVAFLLDNLPPQVTVAMTTRADPPIPLARLRARGELVEVRAADLRFTADEAEVFLNDVMGLRLDRMLCYAYHADLDGIGHGYGPGTDAWCHQLSVVDHLAATIADRLPKDAMLLVTADHGMVAAAERDRIDFDAEPDLQYGVRMLGGEGRVRYLYAEAAALDDVVDNWRGVLGARALVLRRQEAIERGWFGPRVAAGVLPRIGDVVVAAQGSSVVVRSKVEARLSRFVGHHGSLSDAERLVPLLVAVNGRGTMVGGEGS
jgi:hypothetical protein